jgi:hypothetical protein
MFNLSFLFIYLFINKILYLIYIKSLNKNIS